MAAWLAMFATLAAALLPSVSHALANDRIDNLLRAQICAPSGTSYDTVPGDDGKAPGKQAGHMDDCRYCRLSADLPVLPGETLVIGSAPATLPHPPLFYRSPAPLFTWAAAKPRGPPFFA